MGLLRSGRFWLKHGGLAADELRNFFRHSSRYCTLASMQARWIAFYLFGFCPVAFAQQSLPDSLAAQFTHLASDEAKVDTLNTLAAFYMANQPPLAEKHAQQALALAESIGYTAGHARALLHLGDYHFRQSNYALGADWATRSLKVAEANRDSLAMADAYRLLGNINNLGLRQYTTALGYQQKALAIYEKKSDSARTAALYGSITWIYAILKINLEEGHQMAKSGTKMAAKLNNLQLVSYNLNSRGLLFKAQEAYDSAVYYLKRSIEVAQQAEDLAVIGYNKILLGEVMLATGRLSEAERLFREAEEECMALNLRGLARNAHFGLAKTLERTGDYRGAYHFQKRYMQLNDSLVGWETQQKTLLLQLEYQAEKREARIEQLENEKRLAQLTNRIYIGVSLATLAAMLAIIFLLMRNSRQRAAANRVLMEKNLEIKQQNWELMSSREEVAQQRDVVAQQNENLAQLNRTKDRLFSIIGHDLRGPVANLRTLLSLVAKKHVAPEEFVTLAPRLAQQVTQIHDTLENLLQWSLTQMKGVTRHPSAIDVADLLQRMAEAMNPAAQEKGIRLNTRFPASPVKVYADDNQLQLVLRNLLQNALKFTPQYGAITIGAQPTEDWVEIVVADTGIGISPDRIPFLFSAAHTQSTTGTLGEKGTGLGLILCKEMVEANEGRLTVKSEVNKGSTFAIKLKHL